MLTTAWPDRKLTFRNLGWSGDNVFGHSRSVFGPLKDGYKRLIGDLRIARPTVVMVCYGANEAHAGPDGLAEFRSGLNRLLDDIKSLPARAVLVSPLPYEETERNATRIARYNDHVNRYREAIHDVAEQGSLPYVDLSGIAVDGLTTNGVHLSADGYRSVADPIARRLGVLGSPASQIDSPQFEAVRQLTIKKNELFFHRYRPQNETYLFLFRKHEQGNNAVEIPQFDPLVEQQDQAIRQRTQND